MRNTKVLEMRPQINATIEQSSAIESFQNTTLRQILKLQHPITLSLLSKSKHFGVQLKKTDRNDSEATFELIKQFITKDNTLRHKIIGIILGMMTEQEFDFYLKNSSETNKRIIAMQIKRYADSINLIQ